MIRVNKLEGHYTIKIVDRLPPRGNANWLYSLKKDNLSVFYFWNLRNKYEKVSISDSVLSITAIQQGNKVDLTGSGVDSDPYVINVIPQNALETSVTPSGNLLSSNAQDALEELQGKFDQVEDAEENVQSDWNEVDTNEDSFIKNKPTSTSNFTNNGENGTDPFITINEIPEVPVLSVNGEEGEVTVDNISRTIYIDPSEIDGMLDIKPQIVEIINNMNYNKTTEIADIFIRIEEEPRFEEEEGLESFFVTTANECPPLTTVDRTIFWKRKGISITSIPEVGDEMYEDAEGTIPLSGVVPEGDLGEYLRLAESFMNTEMIASIDVGPDGVVKSVNRTIGCL